MAGDAVHLEKNGLAVDVSPLGGAILSAHWHGIPIFAPTSSPGLASQVFGAEACFPLVPFGNRIEGNGFRFEERDYTLTPNTEDPLVLHGDGWLHRWAIQRQEPHHLTLHYRQDAGTASPFAYEAVETITLGSDSLALSLTVTNRHAQTLPYGLGFHPYFPRTPAMRLFARAGWYWPERENHLPAEAEPIPQDLDFSIGAPLPPRWLNHAFGGWGGLARFEYPETGISLSLEAGGSAGFFVLYAPSAQDGFLCFEPMTHAPNAHHGSKADGLVFLPPAARLATRMTIRLERHAFPTSRSSLKI